MKEREPLNFALTALPPPVGRHRPVFWVVEFSTGTLRNFRPELTLNGLGLKAVEARLENLLEQALRGNQATQFFGAAAPIFGVEPEIWLPSHDSNHDSRLLKNRNLSGDLQHPTRVDAV